MYYRVVDTIYNAVDHAVPDPGTYFTAPLTTCCPEVSTLYYWVMENFYLVVTMIYRALEHIVPCHCHSVQDSVQCATSTTGPLTMIYWAVEQFLAGH